MAPYCLLPPGGKGNGQTSPHNSKDPKDTGAPPLSCPGLHLQPSLYLKASIKYEVTVAPARWLGFQVRVTLFLVISVTTGWEGGPGGVLASGGGPGNSPQSSAVRRQSLSRRLGKEEGNLPPSQRGRWSCDSAAGGEGDGVH